MDSSSQPFMLQDGQPVIVGTECSNCHHCWFPEVGFGCERCGTFGEGLATKTFSTQGHLISIADILPGTEKAFTLATIELEDGPAIRAVIGGPAQPSEAEFNIGDPVTGRIETIDGKSVIRFYASPQ